MIGELVDAVQVLQKYSSENDVIKRTTEREKDEKSESHHWSVGPQVIHAVRGKEN